MHPTLQFSQNCIYLPHDVVESKSYSLTEKLFYEKDSLNVGQRKCTEYACYPVDIPDHGIRDTGIKTSIKPLLVSRPEQDQFQDFNKE